MENVYQYEAVRNIQRYLRALSYENPAISRPPLNGVFGSATESALKEFQSELGLEATGRADKNTFDTLYREYLSASARNDTTAPLDFFPTVPRGYEIDLGERSLTVKILQLLLTELSVVFDTLDDIAMTGIYDEATAQNVRKFQFLSSLPVTGRVDRVTWNRILRDYANGKIVI